MRSKATKPRWGYSLWLRSDFLRRKRGTLSSDQLFDAVKAHKEAKFYMVYEKGTNQIIGKFLFSRREKRALLEVTDGDYRVLTSRWAEATSAKNAFMQIRFDLEMYYT